jgi:O-antigen/teichoic acid export membrane protein
MWYGVSSIAARFINYLLTPYLTYIFATRVSDYGKMSLVYAAIPLINVIFTYGLETAYFRFSKTNEDETKVYSTASISMFVSTILLSCILWLFHGAFASFAGLKENPLLIKLTIVIIALDALCTLPFAKLRHQGRPIKFASIRIFGILVNVGATIFFLSYCPQALAKNPSHWVGIFYDTQVNPVVYVILANVLQSGLTLLLLSSEIGSIKLQFNAPLWKNMMIYSLPLLIVGLGGMINETFDRLMLRWWLPASTDIAEQEVGIYSACYKLAILITLFIQAFRMGAEPFFFKQAQGQNPQRTYARVMKFLVIILTFMFLVVALFLPIWKHFIHPNFWRGLGVVPILLMANIFLGIYYNLSIWYKLGNKTRAGAYITLIGAAITVVINWLFIPTYGYMACAWATFFCYGSMMIISFTWGQREYKIPYAWKKLVAYMVIVVLLYFVYRGIAIFFKNDYVLLVVGAILLLIYGWFLLLVEKKEFQKLPIIGRYVK